mmetsp:Transcript_50779/g.118133  ORF Transcript_50779/g.118133 Transcript_50779/m.118133 type:complete len:98 (-) Transcript_50779:148-441(-)
MAPTVKEQIEAADMIAFVTSTCPFCIKALAALKEAGYEPTVVQADYFVKKELSEIAGSTSVPKVWVKGEFIGGCNDGGLGGVMPCLESGKIKELMGA